MIPTMAATAGAAMAKMSAARGIWGRLKTVAR